ncbi:MAG: phage major capsid protein, partial [Candidatus Omnitrophica bacterium]|nr:phage major capsid protein [Candidatus Omnitrophota bacterium]
RREDLSFGRLLRGVLTGDWKHAEAERALMSHRSMTGGGWLIPSPISARIIDLARNKTRCFEAGALTIPMESAELNIARVTQDPNMYWRHENTAVTFSDVVVGKYVLKAKTLMGGCKVSEELIQDAPNAGDIVEQALSSALALELDRAGLYGDGAAAEPMGLVNWDDLQTVDMGSDGDSLSGYAPFSEAVQLIGEANGPTEGLSCIMAPRDLGVLDRLHDGMGNPLQPPESWKAMRKFTTNQIQTNQTKGLSSDASNAFVGYFPEMFFGIRMEATIDVSRDASDSAGGAFSHYQVWIRAGLRADVLVARPSWFVNIDGIVPPADA